MNILNIVGRSRALTLTNQTDYEQEINDIVRSSKFLIIGGAGSIGQEVAKQIFKRDPLLLHVIDINENNTAELVRDLRSSIGYMSGEHEFYPIDMNSREFEVFWNDAPDYDYVLNLAALKHVRSEKHEHTLMRMIKTNIFGTDKTLRMASERNVKKYFAVSSDKAKNPANLMGATKKIMEDVLFTNPYDMKCSTARFANVAFSDGSLLHGFRQRILKKQPLSAPKDIQRYFIVPEEAGELCLMSTLLGDNKDIYFPKQQDELKLTSFPGIAIRFLKSQGIEAVEVDSEDEARGRTDELAAQNKWPCYFFKSDTSGEKPYEEFYSDEDTIDWDKFNDVGVIKWLNDTSEVSTRARNFLTEYATLREKDHWDRPSIVKLITDACPDLDYLYTKKFLDNQM
ncbi:UDP-N-acetylglucosamine 4,6-dehydratase [Emcibacteraceae bacterium]|nr:UDP-N-acetylglucosamine 4,6-dehydratase [Emcibacteraceae bacterium]